MDQSRRAFLRAAAGVAAGFAGLQRVVSAAGSGGLGLTRGSAGAEPWRGYGELVRDPEGGFDVPSGFSYRVITKWGERMDDGLLVPAHYDGMAAFAGPGGLTILVRNHEVKMLQGRYGAFGWNRELQHLVPREKLYDPGHGR